MFLVVSYPFSWNNNAMRLHWHLGDVIEKVAKTRGWTQRELARRAGLSANSMSAIIRTGNCHTTTLTAIAEALNITSSFIQGHVPAPASTQPAHSLCPTNPDHRKYQIMLDQIFHENEQRGEWIRGNVITFHERLFGSSPEGEKFSTEVDILPTDQAFRKDPVKKVGRK